MENKTLKQKNKMEKKIFKYPVQITDIQIISMPKEAVILSVQTQRESPCIWALVDSNNEREQRHFAMFGTGHPIDCDSVSILEFIGTFQLGSGMLVFHLFEIKTQ